MAEQTMARATKRQGKEGNRWVNARPTSEEVGEWFEANVKVDEKLDHKEYVGGVTLIPNTEKTAEVVAWNQRNAPVTEDFFDLVLTPYIRVETRVKYFQDLCQEKGWLGLIEPVEFDPNDPVAKGLPPGFFRHRVGTGPEAGVNFLGCTMRVTVLDRDSVEMVKLIVDKRTGEERIQRTGTVVLSSIATKTVPTLNSKGDADTNALMKVETGAVGRSLGLAGMLVIPGTGIATAEDLQESNQITAAAAQGADFESAALPDGPVPAEEIEPAVALDSQANDEQLRAHAATLLGEMKELPDKQATFQEFKRWADSRGFKRLSEVTSPALRGLARRAETMLAEGKTAAEAPPEPPAPATPTEPTDPLEAP